METQDLKAIENAVRKASAEGMKNTLLQMGFDVENPLDMQKDLMHLREQREAREQITKILRRTVLGSAFTGLLTLLLMGLNHAFNQ